MRFDKTIILGYIGSMATTKNIAVQLRAAIQSDGRSLLAIGKESGVDSSVVWRFVNNQRDIGLTTAARLAAALNLELRPIKKGR